MSTPADALNPAAGESHADRAHLDGKCTSWVDEALDAAGPEYADAPRPGSCCEKDAKASAEARRIRRNVSAADPVRKATALRTSSDPRNAFPGGFDDEAIDEESDDLLTESDEEADDTERSRFLSTKDPALLEIQAKRIAELKLAAEKARAERANTAANASYVAVDEADIPKHLRDGPTRVVLHFRRRIKCQRASDEVFDAQLRRFPNPPARRVSLGDIPHHLGGDRRRDRLPPRSCASGSKSFPSGPWGTRRSAASGFDEERIVRWLAAKAEVLPGHPDAPVMCRASTGNARWASPGPGGGYDDASDEEEGLRRRQRRLGRLGRRRRRRRRRGVELQRDRRAVRTVRSTISAQTLPRVAPGGGTRRGRVRERPGERRRGRTIAVTIGFIYHL